MELGGGSKEGEGREKSECVREKEKEKNRERERERERRCGGCSSLVDAAAEENIEVHRAKRRRHLGRHMVIIDQTKPDDKSRQDQARLGQGWMQSPYYRCHYCLKTLEKLKTLKTQQSSHCKDSTATTRRNYLEERYIYAAVKSSPQRATTRLHSEWN